MQDGHHDSKFRAREAGFWTYDADRRRVTKAVRATTTWYVYDASGNLAAEYGGTGGTAGTQYLTADHLGSTRLVTDATGAVISRHDYLPFGEEIGANVGGRTAAMKYVVNEDLAQRFTGKERDAETGLDYFGARYLSSVQGRWTSADAPFADQFPENPQSWNLYAYVRNNPQRFVDANGRETGVLPLGDGKVVIPRPENAGGIRPIRTVPVGKREALVHVGALQIAGAAVTFGQSLTAQGGLAAAIGVAESAGLFVSGTTSVTSGLLGSDPQAASGATEAVQAVTTPAGVVVTVATGSTTAGAAASAANGAVSFALNPPTPSVNPIATGLSGGLTVGGLLTAVVDFFSPVAPPTPPSPPRPISNQPPACTEPQGTSCGGLQ